jgi:thiosulfate dehydrogenase
MFRAGPPERAFAHGTRGAVPVRMRPQTLAMGALAAAVLAACHEAPHNDTDHEPVRRPQAVEPVAVALGDPVPLVVPDESTIPAGPAGDAIRRGRDLVTRTRELLPNNVGADLHCTSCHLNGGTVAKAGPWVGIVGVFPEYRARAGRVTTLEDRVDECFERSMNGKPLPRKSPEMRAIVAYMSWLSREIPAGHPVEGRGFPRAKAPPEPDRGRGKAIFEQRCVACHGQDGAGRSGPDGAYLFPALWGERSFNVGAGMARLDTAAAFVRWNMPLGAGGTLSEQDAYDVADYFIHQPRPDFAGKENDWPKGGKPRDARY